MPVVSLSQVHCHELESVFRQEIGWWMDELSWDYSPAITLIKRYISSKSLPGCAFKIPSGTVSGYSYYIINEPVGYIGNIYVLSESATPSIYAELLNQILDDFESHKRIQRIESQLFTFNCDLVPLFRNRQFTVIKRYFLERTLDPASVERQPSDFPSGISISRWREKFCLEAARVIHDSYRGSPDYMLCHDYQSPEGCTRFLRNLVQNPGCGTFSPETSLVALEGNGTVCAVLMTSRIEPETGMIPQISVRRDCQGKGLGSLLLHTYFREASRSGLKRLTLSVSETNQRACQLYLRLGFHKIRDFHAFIRP
jgi:GNAT superfamily N-acetyltransferase